MLGFTGTQRGMTIKQMHAVVFHLKNGPEILSAHHGDCIGADAQFDVLCYALGIRRIAHPCDIVPKRAYCPSDVVLPILPPMERNDDIVASATRFLATPKEYHEVLRSGTWATIRRALKAGLDATVILPDGTEWRES